ncbi:hypothetical protein C8R43DRAFT_886500 [Mycena crocata]|nr:hypothetical protein C8R43DRAFT_886500 [Mycena crocata]
MSVLSGNHHGVYLSGTRSSLVAELAAWATTPTADSLNIFWLSGPAGSGKSSVAVALLNYLWFSGSPHASYVYFNRRDEQSATPAAMIHTIASQLAEHNARLKEGILGALIRAPSIIDDQNLETLFKKLILEPAHATAPIDPVLIVIDALDEGKKGPVQDAFLYVLSTGLPKLPKYIRVLIASRRNPELTGALAHIPCVIQHDLSQEIDTHKDIRAYIVSQLEEITSGNWDPSPPEWSKADMIDKLVELADGLFAWAVAACSAISRHHRPNKFMMTLIQDPGNRREVECPLDEMYATALEVAGFADPMRDLLGVIVMAKKTVIRTSHHRHPKTRTEKSIAIDITLKQRPPRRLPGLDSCRAPLPQRLSNQPSSVP